MTDFVNCTIIGVDCAVQPQNVGCALASFADGRTSIRALHGCARGEDPADLIAGWSWSTSPPVLIALDAPLGWPAPLGALPAEHRAGQPPAVGAHAQPEA